MNAPSTTTAASGTACWSCGKAAGGAHFCSACGKILPLPAGADYFAFFGMPRKLQLDSEALERRFHQLSWKLHPDNFVRAVEFERNLSLERSSELNDAYRTLREPVARVEYLLGLAGLRKEGAAKQQAPPELLEEVFELNESLDELRQASAAGAGADLASLRDRLAAAQKNFQQKLDEVDAELAVVFGAWDAALDAGAPEAARRELLARMNEILNRRSYIRNLVATVQSELAEA
ncbi:MAG TPA: Fe-S protein assembly co-chaperone HscB [Candidatus Acidoferrales bacterium]|jgi:molecular chaperone HscB|nr:Fe-S protein assembly co-chaperone HscB [Candidatus Acidoferrales bacterium]